MNISFDPAMLTVIQRSSHPDLKRISSQTVRTLSRVSIHPFSIVFQLQTLLNDRPDGLMVIDARYPFEYAGGHIQSAQNIFTDAQLERLFAELISSVASLPSIVVFHCEYSSERGPHLCRLFRSFDRQHNLCNYPSLSFPFVYLLDGGYAEFFQSSLGKHWCEPQAYISMFAQGYLSDLQRYRQAKKVASGRLRIEHQQPIQFQL